MKQIFTHFQNTIFLILAVSMVFGHPRPYPNSNSSRTESTTITEPDSTLDEIDTELPTLPDTPSDTWRPKQDLFLWAINPGYTIDGTRDVGEFIELHRATTDTSLSLAGYSLRYTNTSGTSTSLFDFSEGSSMVGESLLLRLARSSEPDQADATYMTTLAMSAGRVELLYHGEPVDSVCWSGKDGCYAAFKSAKPTSLVRDFATGEFTHLPEYLPQFDANHPSLVLPEIPTDSDEMIEDSSEFLPTNSETTCSGLEFSEVLSYYTDDKTEQFIELYNPTDHSISLSHCQLRYKKKTYQLDGYIASEQYRAFYPNQLTTSFTLTKNPNTSNTVELLNPDQSVVDTLVYNHGQKKTTSYARFYDNNGEEIWQITYTPTPGEINIFQEFRTCPEGKVINIATGNCINASSLNTTSTDCPEGKYRNPLTGRCKNIESSSTDLKPCAEGYERNPETNRCRKIKQTNSGAEHPLVPETYTDKTTFVALGIVILLVSGGSIYIILQFRREIVRGSRKIRQRLYHSCKNLRSRGVSFHRNKKS